MKLKVCVTKCTSILRRSGKDVSATRTPFKENNFSSELAMTLEFWKKNLLPPSLLLRKKIIWELLFVYRFRSPLKDSSVIP